MPYVNLRTDSVENGDFGDKPKKTGDPTPVFIRPVLTR